MTMVDGSNIDILFFDLLRVSIGTQEKLTVPPSDVEWEMLLEQAVKQSLSGIMLEGVNRLKNGNLNDNFYIPKLLLLEWIGQQQLTIQLNKLQNQRIKDLCAQFEKAGFRGCVLKGQGTALYFDRPEIRQSGDIDIWVARGGKWDAAKSRDDILTFARNNGYHIGHIDIKHSDIDFFEEIPVEVHFLPSWMYSPATNKKLQHFFEVQAERQFENYDAAVGYTHTTIDFDLVFSIVHIYRHIFSEGIGLRQLMDYYYILTHSTKEQRAQAFDVLVSLKMSLFVGGVMWILKKCFGMEEIYLLCPVNKRHGKYLLSEIMTAGNFGQYDDRMMQIDKKKKFRRGIVQLKRNLRFVSYYPSEVLWSPFWKLWHWGWRKWNGYL